MTHGETVCEDTGATTDAPGSCHAGGGGAAVPGAGLRRAVSRGDGGRARALHGPGRTHGLRTRRAFPLARGTAGVLRPGAGHGVCQASSGAVVDCTAWGAPGCLFDEQNSEVRR